MKVFFLFYEMQYVKVTKTHKELHKKKPAIDDGITIKIKELNCNLRSINNKKFIETRGF